MNLLYIKIGLCVLLFACGLAVVWSYNSAITEAQEAKAQLEITAKQLEQARADQAHINEVLVKRKENEHLLRREVDSFKRKFNTISREDASVSSWADMYVPTAVVDLLQDDQ